VHEQRLSLAIHLPDFYQGRVEREHGVEFRTRGVADQTAAQAREGGISSGPKDVETIGGAALDDEDEATLGGHGGKR